ncbi:MAG: hypothetical protein VX346_18240 [Planctomycetota bacterium]|nr:hypothetical protein [Planctomycetota bacterium]
MTSGLFLRGVAWWSSRRWRRVCWSAFITIGVIAQLPASEPPRLPVPPQWRIEDTPYPPPWAQQLPWKGRLQLRFPPGFFQKQDSYFWSYPIFYWLRGDVLGDRAALQRALREYDAGLYGKQFKPNQIKMEMSPDKTRRLGRQMVVYRRVVVDGFDPFVTKRPLKTYLETYRWYCPLDKHTAVLILRSPRRPDPQDPVWKKLLQFGESLPCPEPARPAR